MLVAGFWIYMYKISLRGLGKARLNGAGIANAKYRLLAAQQGKEYI